MITALRRPRRLVRGDRVAVVAPSGPVDRDRLARGCAVLEGWGLQVVVGEHVLRRDRHLAGSDEQRALDLQRAWCDPAVAAVLCARGGSGAARVIDRVDWEAVRRAEPKSFVGFSDATALHEAIATYTGTATLFGPMTASGAFAGDEPDSATREHLRCTLFEPEAVQRLTGDAACCLVPGRATGVTVGGTLSLLASTVGTAESRPAAGGIVVLEDVAEPAYRIDVRLTQLLRTGWFDDVRGVVLGAWTDCGDDAVETVRLRLAPLGVPMLAAMPFGHVTPQLTVPLGAEAELDADAATLTIRAPALV